VRALVQRVSEASVTVNGERVAAIGAGLLVLLGVRRGDSDAEADRLASKLLALRVFEDSEGKMNLSVRDAGGSVLCVSQFTLYGDTRKGNRPSFVEAAPPEEAEPLYERVRSALGAEGGVFGARMSVALTNDGPVTLLIET
jgi:D-tyrosyl-tRNA(Tyr) deacylase